MEFLKEVLNPGCHWIGIFAIGWFYVATFVDFFKDPKK